MIRVPDPATIPHAVHWVHCPPFGLRLKRLHSERLRRASCDSDVTHLFEDSLCTLVTVTRTPGQILGSFSIDALARCLPVESAQLMFAVGDKVKSRRAISQRAPPASRRLSRSSSARLRSLQVQGYLSFLVCLPPVP
jgi:hypothetical protein